MIIISKTMFMVLSSWQSHCENENSPGSFDECLTLCYTVLERCIVSLHATLHQVLNKYFDNELSVSQWQEETVREESQTSHLANSLQCVYLDLVCIDDSVFMNVDVLPDKVKILWTSAMGRERGYG